MRPVIHAQLRTTSWQNLGTVEGLTAGRVRFRWFNGQPQLNFESAEWAAGATIPWSQLPAEARIDPWTRTTATLTQASSLTRLRTVVAYSAFIYLGATASETPMVGTLTWPI